MPPSKPIDEKEQARLKAEMDLRSYALDVSLQMESHAKYLLAEMLGFGEKKSKVLQRLNFDQHIQFFLDLDILNKKEASHFDLFRKIRNQLIHNIHATSVTVCFEILGIDPEKSLLQDFDGERSHIPELRLFSAFQKLVNRLYELTDKIKVYVIESISNERTTEGQSHGFHSYNEAIPIALVETREIIDLHVSKSSTFTENEVLDLFAFLEGRIDFLTYDIFFQRMTKLGHKMTRANIQHTSEIFKKRSI